MRRLIVEHLELLPKPLIFQLLFLYSFFGFSFSVTNLIRWFTDLTYLFFSMRVGGGGLVSKNVLMEKLSEICRQIWTNLDGL